HKRILCCILSIKSISQRPQLEEIDPSMQLCERIRIEKCPLDQLFKRVVRLHTRTPFAFDKHRRNQRSIDSSVFLLCPGQACSFFLLPLSYAELLSSDVVV